VWPSSTCCKTSSEPTKETATPRMVSTCEPRRPSHDPRKPVPKKPAITAVTSGARAIRRYRFCADMARLPLQRVELVDVDGAEIAEQQHQDRQPDGGFGRSHGQHEEHEDLPGRVARPDGK